MRKLDKDRAVESVLALCLAVCLMLAGTLVDLHVTARAAERAKGSGGADKTTVATTLGHIRAGWEKTFTDMTRMIADCPKHWSDISPYSVRDLLQLGAYQVQYLANGTPVLDDDVGTILGPSGIETYYNLDMSWVISRLEEAGVEGEYYVREDGVKMYGDYIMCAADFELRPFGTIVETSLGDAIVCDTGMFIFFDSYHVDIAATW